MFINLFRVFLGLLSISGLSLILFCMATNQNMDLPILMQFALMGCFIYGLQLAIKSREVI
jgi:sugar phosphate permease